MTWAIENIEWIGTLLSQHVVLALVPTVIGIVGAVPLGLAAHRTPRVRRAVTLSCNVAYTIPSLALFMLIPLVLGTSYIDPLNVVVALTLYSLALSVRAVFTSLESVSPVVLDAARAVGFSRGQRSWRVELPLAGPVLVTNARVVAVTNVSLVSVGSLIGVGGLGQLFTSGYQRSFVTEIVVGVVCVLLLAFVIDRCIALIGWWALPWNRGVGRAPREKRSPDLVRGTEAAA